ncbi:MAG TPA: AraC family transcriptional regulator [Chthoniobacteraceae bacterium]|nr:AraC family transcriptional regulator [Chthoniobacteraceae bacterium]
MGVCLYQVFSSRFPLGQVSEQVMVIPAGEPLEVGTTGAPKILYCLGGEAILSLEEGVSFEIAPGDTVILPFRQLQRYTSPPSSGPVQVHMLLIRFEPERHPPIPGTDTVLQDYLNATFTENRHLRSRSCYPLWELACRIRHESESPRLFKHRYTCELARAFTFLVAEVARFHDAAPLPAEVARVRNLCDDFLRHPFQKPEPLETVAERFGVSVATLNRAFREVTGHSCARHADWMAMERAKLLLLNSHLSVATLARRFAFSSPSAFSRAFRKTTGLTPKGYRNSYDGTPLTWSNPATRRKGFQPRHHQNRLPDESWRVVALPASFRVEQRSVVTALRGALTLETGGVEHHLDERDRVALLLAPGEEITVRPRSAKSPEKARLLLLQGGVIALDAENAGEPGVRPLLDRLETALAAQRLLSAAIPLWSDLALLRASVAARSAASADLSGRPAGLGIASLCRLVSVEVMRALLLPQKAAEAPPRAAPGHRLLLSHANNFIHKHYRRPLTLNEIAWAVGVSGEHLARVFRLETGRTVMDHLQACRIRRARTLLVTSNRTMAEIAEHLNFSSVALFHRVFRRHTGCTPGEFRRKGIAALS